MEPKGEIPPFGKGRIGGIFIVQSIQFRTVYKTGLPEESPYL
jgi:hypothetical protein